VPGQHSRLGLVTRARHLTNADESRPRAGHLQTPENTMLQIFLIGAALSHARPEPPRESGLPTDPLRVHRERWRCTSGAAVFWH